jgi:hypothetical protein
MKAKLAANEAPADTAWRSSRRPGAAEHGVETAVRVASRCGTRRSPSVGVPLLT